MLAAVATDLPPLGLRLPLWSVIPFALTLASLAVFPVAAARFWHAHYPKVIGAIALAFTVPFLIAFRGEAVHELAHITLADYVPFVVLLFGLYTTAGGLILKGDLRGTPAVNTALLAFGTAIASVIGTTGASMLLIRPLLRANAHRARRGHLVVFFIFLVANIGGCLTPLGDPPLFLGFLAGVPFGWTLRLAPQLGFLAAVLLPLFYVVDRRFLAREQLAPHTPPAERQPLRLEGKRNLFFLAGIVGAVLLSGVWDAGTVPVMGASLPLAGLVRDALIVLCGVGSLMATPKAHREDNAFSWEPVREVVILFAGIFATILPVLAILAAGPEGALAPLFNTLDAPWHYFWTTGLLSSFLDNAPTYLTLLNGQIERFGTGGTEIAAAAVLAKEHARHLAALSAGAVFMGANTYIGNAPNFIVKAIAEDAGVRMPSFFGYIVRWSLPILIPLFALLTIIFY
jgi:Na+/H+ antiporter NhaD/arsenite permease-like protein